MSEKILAPKERKCYFDEMGIEIREGDLLKVYHFRHYLHRRKMFMYHIAILQQNKDGYWWAAKEYNREGDKGHYWLLAVANKETGMIMGTQIIASDPKGWEQDDQIRKEGIARLKIFTTPLK